MLLSELCFSPKRAQLPYMLMLLIAEDRIKCLLVTRVMLGSLQNASPARDGGQALLTSSPFIQKYQSVSEVGICDLTRVWQKDKGRGGTA